MSDELLDIPGLALKLKISEITIRRLLKKGLPAYQAGGSWRFDFQKVLAWMEKK